MTDEDDEYQSRVPRFVCPECGVTVAVSYPHDVYCVDCEEPMASVPN